MSYTKTLKLNYENISSSFRNECGMNRDTLNEDKLEIYSYCMKKHTEDDRKVIHNLSFKVRLYIRGLKSQYSKEICDEVKENGEISFYGWGFSRECDFDLDRLIDSAIENLTLLTLSVVDNFDYFSERENFYEKYNAIKSELDLEEEIYDIVAHDFIEQHREYDTKAEDIELDDIE